MNTLIQNKNAVVILVVIVLVFFLFSIFMSPDPMPLPEGNEGVSADASLVELSEELSSITLRQDLFNTAAYRYLVDYSAVLLQQPTGRPNPFNIIGRD